MKKTISLVMVLALCFALLVPSVYADGTSVIVSSPSAAPGEQVTVSVSLTGNSGFCSCEMKLNYDATELEFVSASSAYTSIVPEVGNMSFALASLDPIVGDITLMTATFKVKDTAKTGNYNVGVSVDFISDENDNDLVSGLNASGVVKVTRPPCASHTWVAGEVTQPKDCVNEQKTKFTCTVCGAEEIRTTDTAAGHNWGAWTKNEVTGKHERTCSNPNCPVGKQEEDHAYGEWTVDTPSTCTTKGTAKRTCECGAYETKELDLADHPYGGWIDCEDGTYHERFCTACGYADIEKHTWGATPVKTVEPDCKNAGYKEYKCEKCTATKRETIPSTGAHNFANWVDKGDGTHIGTCTGCNTETKTEAHEYGDWTVVTPSTCIANGKAERTCKCGVSEEKELDLADHKYGPWTENKDTGMHEHSCLTNGCDRKEEADHVWDSGKVTTPATCVEDGVKTFVCKDCKATKTEVIPATGEHDFTHSYKHDAETHQGVCACGAVDNMSSKHSFTINGEVLEKPTTTMEGKQEMLCVCGEKTVVTLDKIPAEYDKVHQTGDITGQIVLYTTAVIAVVAGAAYVLKRRIAG